MATQKTIDYALRALPYLVACVEKHKTVTNVELSEYIGCHHHVVHHFLSYIRDIVCAPRKMPMLTAIVVSQNTHQPFGDWLPEGHFSKAEYQVKFERLRDEVFAFSSWNDLLKELNLTPLNPE